MSSSISSKENRVIISKHIRVNIGVTLGPLLRVMIQDPCPSALVTNS